MLRNQKFLFYLEIKRNTANLKDILRAKRYFKNVHMSLPYSADHAISRIPTRTLYDLNLEYLTFSSRRQFFIFSFFLSLLKSILK